MPTPARAPRGAAHRLAAAAGLAALTLAAALAPGPGRAGEAVLLRPGAGRVDLGPWLEVLLDPSGSLDREGAMRATFAPARRAGPGLVRGALWVRFTVENGSSERRDWIATFPGATLDRIDAWIDAGGATVERGGGLAVAPASRTIALGPGWQELPIPLGAGERATVLARLASRGPLHAEATAEEPEPHARRLAASAAAGAALAAVLFALALGAAAAFRARRAHVHLDLALLAAALGALSLAAGGAGPALLWPGARWWAAAAPPALAAVAAHLSVRVAGGLLGRALRGAAAAVAWFAAASAVVALPFASFGNVSAGVAVLAALGLVATWTVRAVRDGDPRARPLAAGAAPLGVFAAAAVLAGAGLVPAPSQAALAVAFVLATVGAGVASLGAAAVSAAAPASGGAGLDRAAGEAARAALERAVEARTRELGQTIDALRREGEARRRAEDGKREAEESLRRAEEGRGEAEAALRRAEEERRLADEALRRAEEGRRDTEAALRRAEEGRRDAEAALRRERLEAVPGGAADMTPPAPDVPRRPPAVLLVDEDDVVLEGTRRQLERLGYRVLAAPDGARALDACEGFGGVDVVVVEVVLPGMTGKELADRLLARWPGTRVLLTAGSAQDVLGPEPGGFPFLAKPYSTGALAAKVRDLLAPPVARKAG